MGLVRLVGSLYIAVVYGAAVKLYDVALQRPRARETWNKKHQCGPQRRRHGARFTSLSAAAVKFHVHFSPSGHLQARAYCPSPRDAPHGAARITHPIDAGAATWTASMHLFQTAAQNARSSSWSPPPPFVHPSCTRRPHERTPSTGPGDRTRPSNHRPSPLPSPVVHPPACDWTRACPSCLPGSLFSPPCHPSVVRRARPRKVPALLHLRDLVARASRWQSPVPHHPADGGLCNCAGAWTVPSCTACLCPDRPLSIPTQLGRTDIGHEGQSTRPPGGTGGQAGPHAQVSREPLPPLHPVSFTGDGDRNPVLRNSSTVPSRRDQGDVWQTRCSRCATRSSSPLHHPDQRPAQAWTPAGPACRPRGRSTP